MIILTRPYTSNLRLMKHLPADKVLNLPALELVPLQFQIPEDIYRYKLIFFASGFAARTFLDGLQKERVALASDVLLLTVGRSTAKTIRACLKSPNQSAKPQIITPETFGADSAALIKTYRQQLAHVYEQQPKPPALIVRSHSGRQELPDFLTAQGHAVDYLPVYERRAAVWSDDVLLKLADNRVSGGHIWLMSSSQGVDSILSNLSRIRGLTDTMRKDRFVVLHERIASHLLEQHTEISAENIFICSPEDAAILDAINPMRFEADLPPVHSPPV